ncbi:hypothetical protein BG003_003097 [Podila horticola]|nr:hypothetical protein BG003_003097 [Podila horticola]
MEHCSEPGNARDCEGENGDYDESEDDKEPTGQGKKRKVMSRNKASPVSTRPPPRAPGTSVRRPFDGVEYAHLENGDDDGEQSGTVASSSSSRKPSVTSMQEEEKVAIKAPKSSRKDTRPSSVPDIPESTEERPNPMRVGSLPLTNKGRLRLYSQRVCDKVEAKGTTTYNELVQELSDDSVAENEETGGQEANGQESIRRRVYDALNVLAALDIIAFDHKDIQWVGIDKSKAVHEITRRQAAAEAAASGLGPMVFPQRHEHEGDEESEEPEDDDMDIEQLQKSMASESGMISPEHSYKIKRLEEAKELEREQRHEAREQEREERRRQRKLQRDEEKRSQAMDTDPSMTDVGPNGSSELSDEAHTRRKTERQQRRRRTPRHQTPDVSERAGNGEDVEEDMDDDREDEETRRRRRRERRERKERKEKRAQRRMDKEAEAIAAAKQGRIQLPFLVVRMPGYVGQSSDSESGISVESRIREEQKAKKSGKSKRQCEATGEKISTVEIRIPQHEELSVISDTEILGDLGLNSVSMEELQTMLPGDLMDSVQYVTNSSYLQPHPQSHVTVQSGFEREIYSAPLS